MIVDSSAIVELLLAHPGAARIEAALRSARRVAVGAPTLAETSSVLRSRLGSPPEHLLDRFLLDFRVDVIAFTDAHRRAASAAYDRFGKGRHPAGLNFGDCLTYAVALLEGEPLLFVGNDFARTDLAAA